MKQIIIKSYDKTKRKFTVTDEQADEVIRLLDGMIAHEHHRSVQEGEKK